MIGPSPLLAGAVDYAGLFPPAGLEMASAVRAYASHRAGPDSWMLGRFVVPAARVREMHGHLAGEGRRPGGPWRLSALLGRDLQADLEAIQWINRAAAEPGAAPLAVVDACEAGVDSVAAVDRLARILAPEAVAVFYEVDPTLPERPAVLAAICAAGGAAKIRTGGLEPDAIPSAGAVAAFVWDCIVTGVPFKATAGLHHPLRGLHPLRTDPAGPSAVMHGFLNLYAATLIGAAGRESGTINGAEGVALIERVLAETDPGAFRLGQDGLRWRERHVTAASIERLRPRTIRSFGSCSFDDPVADLEFLATLGRWPRPQSENSP